MKIQVLNDDGSVTFTFDPAVTAEATVGMLAADRTAITNALHDAQSFLSQDKTIIASIKSDIHGAVSRIETELGAHPAFTWAQTKLANAIAHLEAYVKGSWTEPQPEVLPPGVAMDARGVPVKV